MVGPRERVRFFTMGMKTLGVKAYWSSLALKKLEFWFPPSDVSFPKPKNRLPSTPEAYAYQPT